MNESNREVLRQAESIIADQQPLPALPDLKAMIVALEKEAQFVMAIKILNAAHKSNPQEEWISDQISRLLRVAANKTIAATEYISELKHIKWLLNELKANLEFGLGRKVLAFIAGSTSTGPGQPLANASRKRRKFSLICDSEKTNSGVPNRSASSRVLTPSMCSTPLRTERQSKSRIAADQCGRDSDDRLMA